MSHNKSRMVDGDMRADIAKLNAKRARQRKVEEDFRRQRRDGQLFNLIFLLVVFVAFVCAAYIANLNQYQVTPIYIQEYRHE